MSEFEQNPVSTVVWPWTQSKEPPKPLTLGQRLASKALWKELIINIVVVFLVGYLFVYWYKGHHKLGYFIFSVAGFIMFTAVFIPPVHAKIKKGFAWFGRMVGIAMSWILLVPFYFLLITPGHFFMTLKGKDPMTRTCPTDEKTYWVPRKKIKNMDQYKKQH